MTAIDIKFILAIEAALIATVVCVILSYKIKSLNKSIASLKERIRTLLSNNQSKINETTHRAFLETEIKKTYDHFTQLHTNKDIDNSLTDEIINIQAISLRFHTLHAEYAHLAADNSRATFDQIIHSYEKHVQSLLACANKKQLSALLSQMELLEDELMQNKKTISHLESLKHHYDDLEVQLSSCQDNAQNHLQTLNNHNEDLSPDIKASINAYSKSFEEMAALLKEGKSLSDAAPSPLNTEKEIENLRLFAVSQHKMIEELQAKLLNQSKISHDEESMSHITSELNKQKQFVKEAETCTQLLEDELANASREIRGLKAQVKLQNEQQHDSEDKDLEISLLKEENTKLKDQLKQQKP